MKNYLAKSAIAIVAVLGLGLSACHHHPRVEPRPTATGAALKKEVGTFKLHSVRSMDIGRDAKVTESRDFPVPQGLPVDFSFTGSGTPVRVTIHRYRHPKDLFLDKIVTLSDRPQVEQLTFPFTGMVTLTVEVVSAGDANVVVQYSDYHD